MPKLIVTEQGSEKKDVFEFSSEGVSIGRSGENSITLNSSGVSRKHAQITVNGNHCFLLDMGSGNGTFLNGTKVKDNQETILRHGDTISIDNYNINFHNLDEMLASSFNEVTDSDILEVKLLKKVLKAIDKEKVPNLEVLNGNFIGKKLFLPDDEMEVVIGRDETCDFPIEEYVISRRHAKIVKAGNEITIEDLSSKNGSFINNRKITKETLHDGDRIAFGTIVVIFRDPSEVNVSSMSVRKKEAPRAIKPRLEPKQEQIAEEDNDLSHVTEEGVFEENAPELSLETPDNYPAPAPRREKIKLSFVELGLIGLGILIFAFAMISFVNLLIK